MELRNCGLANSDLDMWCSATGRACFEFRSIVLGLQLRRWTCAAIGLVGTMCKVFIGRAELCNRILESKTQNIRAFQLGYVSFESGLLEIAMSVMYT